MINNTIVPTLNDTAVEIESIISLHPIAALGSLAALAVPLIQFNSLVHSDLTLQAACWLYMVTLSALLSGVFIAKTISLYRRAYGYGAISMLSTPLKLLWCAFVSSIFLLPFAYPIIFLLVTRTNNLSINEGLVFYSLFLVSTMILVFIYTALYLKVRYTTDSNELNYRDKLFSFRSMKETSKSWIICALGLAMGSLLISSWCPTVSHQHMMLFLFILNAVAYSIAVPKLAYLLQKLFNQHSRDRRDVDMWRVKQQSFTAVFLFLLSICLFSLSVGLLVWGNIYPLDFKMQILDTAHVENYH